MQSMPERESHGATPFKHGQIRDVVVRDVRKFMDERGWLAELFRHDDMDAEYFPTMSYISSTGPGV